MLPPDKPPASICILRLSALGDVTHVVPVVRAIRNHWPDTAITWIIGKHEHGLVAGMDELEFLPFDKRAGWAEVRRLRAQLRHREFDVLLHMQVALRANLLSLLVKAPIRLGWDKPRSQDRHTWFINHSIRSVPHQHQVEGFLEFARALGVPVSHLANPGGRGGSAGLDDLSLLQPAGAQLAHAALCGSRRSRR